MINERDQNLANTVKRQAIIPSQLPTTPLDRCRDRQFCCALGLNPSAIFNLGVEGPQNLAIRLETALNRLYQYINSDPTPEEIGVFRPIVVLDLTINALEQIPFDNIENSSDPQAIYLEKAEEILNQRLGDGTLTQIRFDELIRERVYNERLGKILLGEKGDLDLGLVPDSEILMKTLNYMNSTPLDIIEAVRPVRSDEHVSVLQVYWTYKLQLIERLLQNGNLAKLSLISLSLYNDFANAILDLEYNEPVGVETDLYKRYFNLRLFISRNKNKLLLPEETQKRKDRKTNNFYITSFDE